MTKIRFHLGHGEHYRTWRIQTGDVATFIDPDEWSIVMFKCELKNHRRAADRIYTGETNKTVCAWVACKQFEIVQPSTIDEFVGEQLRYNPHIHPYWVDGRGNNIDSKKFPVIVSRGRELFEWYCNPRIL